MMDTGATLYFAPAKVNLGLSVRGLRADGYHELHSLMVPLAVGDDLEIERAEGLTLEVVGADLPTDERNLVYRAAHVYLEAAGAQGGEKITLHKRLPLASGLGGGSSDAATTLMALARLYPAPRVSLAALARKLGADVPFFLLGCAAAAQGVGEVLTPLPVPRTPLVLVNPGVEVSARDAYTWLDQEENFTGPLNIDAVLARLADGGEVPYFNALQEAVQARHAPIREAITELREAGLRSPLMSGSGSTCFALAPNDDSAFHTAKRLRAQHPDWWVTATRTLE